MELPSIERESRREKKMAGSSSRGSPAESSPDGSSDPNGPQTIPESIIWIETLKNTQMFVACTTIAVYIFRLKPLCVVAVFTRSSESLNTHGANHKVCFRPEGKFIALATTKDYLFILRILSHDIPTGEVCVFGEAGALDSRQSLGTFPAPGEGPGVREVNIRCDHWAHITTGIDHLLGLESRLVIVSRSQRVCACDWEDFTITSDTNAPDDDLATNGTLEHIAWSKAMGLFAIINKGKVSTGMLGTLPSPGEWFELICDTDSSNSATATATPAENSTVSSSSTDKQVSEQHQHLLEHQKPLHQGSTSNTRASFSRHPSMSPGLVLAPDTLGLMALVHDTHNRPTEPAVSCALNARFSAVAVGCKTGAVHLYNIRDYSGNIRRIRVMRPPSTTAGSVSCLRWSMDGYALFVGYATGWALFSVYGMLNASSFLTTNDQKQHEPWLGSIKYVAWSLAADRLFLCPQPGSNSLWSFKTMRWASLNNFSTENLHRPILVEDGCLSVYRGHNLPGLTTIDRDALLWLRVPIPGNYVADNWPIRHVTTSADGRYIAVAGSRGLTHYSLFSGRWKLFEDEFMELEFSVRAMQWGHGRYLFVAVDTDRATHELRVYSRDQELHPENVMAAREFLKPILRICLYKSLLLVYTYDNILHVYQVRTLSNVALFPLRKICLDSVVHSPARVRSIACIPSMPSESDTIEDPDIASLNLVILVDGMLTLLRPDAKALGRTQNDEIDYEIYTKTVLHHTVEYCNITADGMLRAFDGQSVLIWDTSDFSDFGGHKSMQAERENGDSEQIEFPTAKTHFNAQVPVESYPVAVLKDKGIIAEVDTDTILNRHAGFTTVTCFSSTQLYVPYVLEAYLERDETDKAYQLAKKYQHLKYMSHILEMLIYRVMDTEQPSNSKLLQHAVNLVCKFPQMLDVFLGCTRKTEVKYWGELFQVLGSPQDLFDRCLDTRQLSTAAGYLLILHTVEDGKKQINQKSEDNTQRLLKLAYEANDFELCKELARFLTAIDPSANLLRGALKGLDESAGQIASN